MLLEIIKIPLIALEVLVVFNLMIVVHELGHFLAAKWRGLKIEKFGIWFGKPLWKKNINGVEYSFGTIPFGGFVALPQMAPMETLEGKSETPRERLPEISVADKIIVAFAGPLFSFLLAVTFAIVVWQVGRPVSEGESTTVIGWVVPDSLAAEAGLKAGDKVLEVDGHKVTRFEGIGTDSIKWDIVRSEGATIPMVVERMVDGKPQTVPLAPAFHIENTTIWQRKALREIGAAPMQHMMVAGSEPGSPAEKAGFKANDIIETIDGEPAYTVQYMEEYMGKHPATSYKLGVLRNETGRDSDAKNVELTLAPDGVKIDGVTEKSPAELGGLKAGDTILTMNGQPVPSSIAVTEYIFSHGTNPIDFTVRDKAGAVRTAKVTPQLANTESETKDIPHIGVEWAQTSYGIVEDEYGKLTPVYPFPTEQIRGSVLSIVDTVGAIASQKSNVKLQHMGGPLMMFRVYYMFFQNREGWKLALWFSVVLNVNLALLNLLPLPVLDGGHITLALLEGIRRRPINARFVEIVNTACAVVILGFMLYIAYFDAQDYVGHGPEKLRFEPSNSPTPAQQSGK